MQDNGGIRQEKSEKKEEQKGYSWPNTVSLGFVCAATVAIVFIIWGQC